MNISSPQTPSPVSLFLKGFGIGVVGLLSFYYLLLLVVTRDFLHPLSQFAQFQPWISLLVIGFGIQFGLYWLVRRGYRLKRMRQKDSTLTTGTSTTLSGFAMIACCAHHAIDIVPFLGISAAAVLLTAYQTQIMIFGIVANILGIIMMLWMMTRSVKKHSTNQHNHS